MVAFNTAHWQYLLFLAHTSRRAAVGSWLLFQLEDGGLIWSCWWFRCHRSARVGKASSGSPPGEKCVRTEYQAGWRRNRVLRGTAQNAIFAMGTNRTPHFHPTTIYSYPNRRSRDIVRLLATLDSTPRTPWCLRKVALALIKRVVEL